MVAQTSKSAVSPISKSADVGNVVAYAGLETRDTARNVRLLHQQRQLVRIGEVWILDFFGRQEVFYWRFVEDAHAQNLEGFK
jgi:hypothetical protein